MRAFRHGSRRYHWFYVIVGNYVILTAQINKKMLILLIENTRVHSGFLYLIWYNFMVQITFYSRIDKSREMCKI